MGVVEIRAVVYRCLFCGCSAEYFWLPGVEVRVEVDYGYGAVGFVDGAQEGERDSVVAAERYDAREGLFVLCGANFFCICGGCAHEEAVVAVFDLLDCVGVVVAGGYVSVVLFELCASLGRRDVRCNRYVAAVDHCGPTVERIGVQGDVVAAAGTHFA